MIDDLSLADAVDVAGEVKHLVGEAPLVVAASNEIGNFAKILAPFVLDRFMSCFCDHHYSAQFLFRNSGFVMA